MRQLSLFSCLIKNLQLPGVDIAGSFGYGLPSNFAAPANSGWYKIT